MTLLVTYVVLLLVVTSVICGEETGNEDIVKVKEGQESLESEMTLDDLSEGDTSVWPEVEQEIHGDEDDGELERNETNYTTWRYDDSDFDPTSEASTCDTELALTTKTPQPSNSTELALSTKAPQSADSNLDKLLYLGKVMVPSLLVVGVTGNCMSVIIMRRPSFRAMTMGHVLISLAVSDTTLILMFPFNKTFIMDLLGLDVRGISYYGCKFFFWLWRTAKMTSSWLVVIISLERAVAVLLPLKAHQINSSRNILIAIFTNYFVISLFNMIWQVFSDRTVGGFCVPNIPTQPRYAKHAAGFVLAGTVLYSIIPAIIIILLNIAIISSLVSQRNKRAQLEAKGSRTKKSESQARQATAMLVAVAVAFVIMVVPISITHCVSLALGKNIFRTTDLKMSILREITQLMEQLNYSINFFMYVLCSEKFRKELRQIFCKEKRKPISRETSMTGVSTLSVKPVTT